MIVAYAADINLYEYLQPAIASLLAHNPEVKEIHVFLKEKRNMQAYGLTDERIIFHPFKDTFHFISTLGPYADYRFGLMTFSRLALPTILENESRVLYLDVDTLIRGNLSEFYNIDLDGYAVAGVKEPNKSKNGYIYLNAGVLLLNLDYIRDSGLWKEWLTMANEGPMLRDGDQDIINNTCQGKILTIDSKYNSNPYTFGSKNPIIEHGTPVKPWSPKSKYFDEYKFYRQQKGQN